MSADPSRSSPLDQAGASDEQIQQVHAILLREKPEPTEGYSPLPLMLLGLMSAFILFCAIYLGRYSGGFDPMVYDERILPGMLEGGRGARGAGPQGARPAGVHGQLHRLPSDRRAWGCRAPIRRWPDPNGRRGPRSASSASCWTGSSGPITVKDSSFNNSMPAFGPLLRDEQIADVLTYVRSEWGNNAPAVSPDKVKEIRAAVAGRTGPWAPRNC